MRKRNGGIGVFPAGISGIHRFLYYPSEGECSFPFWENGDFVSREGARRRPASFCFVFKSGQMTSPRRPNDQFVFPGGELGQNVMLLLVELSSQNWDWIEQWASSPGVLGSSPTSCSDSCGIFGSQALNVAPFFYSKLSLVGGTGSKQSEDCGFESHCVGFSRFKYVFAFLSQKWGEKNIKRPIVKQRRLGRTRLWS